MKFSRRRFFAALAGLPLVQKLVPKSRAYAAMDVSTQPSSVGVHITRWSSGAFPEASSHTTWVAQEVVDEELESAMLKLLDHLQKGKINK